MGGRRRQRRAIKVLIEGGADVKLKATGLPRKADDDAEPTQFYANMVSRRMDQLTPLLLPPVEAMDAVRALLDAGASVNDQALMAPALSAWPSRMPTTSSPAICSTGARAQPSPPTDGRPCTVGADAETERGADGATGGHDAESGLELAKKLIARGADVNARMTREVNDGYRRFEKRRGARRSSWPPGRRSQDASCAAGKRRQSDPH